MTSPKHGAGSHGSPPAGARKRAATRPRARALVRPAAIVVFCACPDAKTAARIGRTVVEERLAGCAQVLTAPIRSIYRWQGRVQDEAETLLLVKAQAAAWSRLRERIASLHPYAVPEILACAANGNEPYLRWLAQSRRESTR
jgi:periplasmic divalent cation tolerance protein